MWFNLLKLDLASVSTQIQGDTEGQNINIDAEDKCRKKLINFQKKLTEMEKRNKGMVELSMSNKMEIPEFIACQFVEKIDEYFNTLEVPKFSNGRFVGPEYEKQGKIENYDYWTWYRIHNASRNPVISLVFVLGNGEVQYSVAFMLMDSLLTYALKKHWEES
jgi:hypothetical protein